jgi:hypothetical protein
MGWQARKYLRKKPAGPCKRMTLKEPKLYDLAGNVFSSKPIGPL